jgi:hypothetical protein
MEVILQTIGDKTNQFPEYQFNVFYPIAIMYQDPKSENVYFKFVEPLSLVDGSTLGLKSKTPFLLAVDFVTREEYHINLRRLRYVFPITKESLDAIALANSKETIFEAGVILESLFTKESVNIANIDGFGFNYIAKYNDLLEKFKTIKFSADANILDHENTSDEFSRGVSKFAEVLRQIVATSDLPAPQKDHMHEMVAEAYHAAPYAYSKDIRIKEVVTKVNFLSRQNAELITRCAKNGIDVSDITTP